MSVVVTGLGVVCSAGTNTDTLWTSVSEGRSSFRPIRRFSTDGFAVHRGAEVPGDEPGPDPERLFRFLRNAAKQAVGTSTLNPKRTGICLGTTQAGIEYAERLLEESPIPTFPAFRSLYHTPAQMLADELHLEGPCLTFNVACASALHAVAYAFERLEAGEVDAMIVGGVDVLSPFVFAGFHALQALSRTEVRPFDLHRDGMLLGEGAGVLLLERTEVARQRGVPVLAHIRGWGMMEDATHLTTPDPTGTGMARSIRQAMQIAGISEDEIGYIHAHGTGTRYNDRSEVRAIRTVFGAKASRIPMSSTKGVTGHCLGASAALETIIGILALHHQIVPPTAGYQTPDPECDLDFVPGRARAHRFKSFLKLAAGFGGQNGALVVGKP